MRNVIKIVLTLLFGVFLVGGNSTAAFNHHQSRTFTAHLTSDQEVPPRNSPAQGQAIFRLSHNGNELHFRVNVANIHNVVGAHVHNGAVGVNGPIVFGFFSAPPNGGRFSGVLAEGVLTRQDFPTFDALVALIQSGNAYVNVHTNDGVAPTNTGPGDFPGGEIRGQLR
jgi:CHRD domain